MESFRGLYHWSDQHAALRDRWEVVGVARPARRDRLLRTPERLPRSHARVSEHNGCSAVTSEHRRWFCIMIFVANTIVYGIMLLCIGELKYLWVAPIGGFLAAVITHASLDVITVQETKQNTQHRKV